MSKSLVCAVAGISFYQDNLEGLSIGDKLDIIPQPENPYDPGALAVFYNGKQLGYLPKVVSERFTTNKINGEIIYILKGKLTGLRIRLFLNPINLHQENLPPSYSEDILVRDKRNNRILGFLLEKNNNIAVIKSKNSTIRRRVDNLEFSAEPLFI